MKNPILTALYSFYYEQEKYENLRENGLTETQLYDRLLPVNSHEGVAGV